MGVVSGGGGGGTVSPVSLSATTLSSAQILALATTAIAVTPTPAAGSGYMVLQVWAAYHFNTVDYSGTDFLTVAPNLRAYGQFKCGIQTLLNNGADAVAWFDQSAAYNSSSLEFDHTNLLGFPWSIKDDSGASPPTLGNGTMTVYCTYAAFTP